MRPGLVLPGEGRPPHHGLGEELAHEGPALHGQPVGSVGRAELDHQPGPTDGEGGVGELGDREGECRDLEIVNIEELST